MSGLLAVILPLALVVLMAIPGRARKFVCLIAPLAPLALLPVLLAPGHLELGLQLVGLMLTPDSASMPLMWLTLLAWTLAGWLAASHIDRRRTSFWCGWLLALTGMNLLLLAGNLVTFYLGYALMSLSAYLLVVHSATDEAWRAGRIYLILALIGEAAILAGILLVAGQLGNVAFVDLSADPLAVATGPARWVLLAGFAVKLGIVPLHMWLPLAHPVAPVAASAILSGIMVKAGLMGWIRMVPVLAADPPVIGQMLLTLGLITAFAGVMLGLTQKRIKTVLAYSTISQMGLVLCGFSLIFLIPTEREMVLAMLGLLALHHGLNKAALFIACACQPGASRWRLLLFALPALSLAAVPISTGFLAKDALKSVLALAMLGEMFIVVLALTSTATALLMWKAFRLAQAMNDASQPIHPAWVALVLAALAAPWLHAVSMDLVTWPGADKLFDATWPLLLAMALIALWQFLPARLHLKLPEGDLVVIFERLAGWLARAGRRAADMKRSTDRQPLDWHDDRGIGRSLLNRLAGLEASMPLVGLALLATAVLLWLLAGG